MSVLKLIKNGQHNSIETLPDILSYILRNTATRPDYMYSPNTPIYAASVTMQQNKEVHYQWKGKGYHHIMLSPRPRDLERPVVMEVPPSEVKVDLCSSFLGHNSLNEDIKTYLKLPFIDRLYHAGEEIANWLSTFQYGQYLIVMAMHFDTDIPHLHFVMDNIDYATGKRLNLGCMELLELKQQCSLILMSYGISKVSGSWQELTYNRNEPYHFDNGKKSFILKKSNF